MKIFVDCFYNCYTLLIYDLKKIKIWNFFESAHEAPDVVL